MNEKKFNIKDYISKNTTARKIANSCYRLKTKKFYYSVEHNKIDIINTDKELQNIILYDYPHLKKVGQKGGVSLDLPQIFLDNLFFLNSIDEIVEQVDLFQKEPFKLIKEDKILRAVRNKYIFKTPERLNGVTDKIMEDIAKDYKEHFPEYSEFLEWVIACRFAHDRKSSFTHLWLSANFGKSFISSIFQNIGIVSECDYSDFKSPSPLSAGQFRNSFILLIDEFTIFKKEFKNHTHSMKIAPKFELNTTVELFAKVFLSAEPSESFMGGVDKQISDRVSQIVHEKIKIDLNQRKAFLDYGAEVYFNAILHYTYGLIVNRLNDYVSMSKVNASRRADDILRQYHIKYALKTPNLENEIRIVFWENILELAKNKEYDNDNLSMIERDISRCIIVKKEKIEGSIDKYDISYIIKSLPKVFEMVMKNQGEAFSSKTKFKSSKYLDILGLKKEDLSSHKVNGKTERGLKFKPRDILSYVDDKNNIQDLQYKEIKLNMNDVLEDSNKNSLFKRA